MLVILSAGMSVISSAVILTLKKSDASAWSICTATDTP
jgi:hypothetical protein